MRKKVFVTGAAGFIASHLVETLSKRGYDVLGIDDLSTGKIENIEGLDINFVQADITGRTSLQFLLEDENVDCIFHLAAIASVAKSILNPERTNKVGIDGTLNVLLAARDAGIRRVVLASSAAVYGNNPIQPKKENMVPEPGSPYATSKITGEYYLKNFYDLYGLETVSLRYFNVYGTRQDPSSEYSGVISRFLDAKRKGEQPTIYGDGTQSRDFVAVEDVVEANILAMNTFKPGEVYNVGTGWSISINEIARILDLDPIYAPARIGDIHNSVADIYKAQDAGFTAKVRITKGLKNPNL
jgi:UDP-glucose 4-epimerase